MNDYAALADYYDRLQFDVDYRGYAAMVRRLLRGAGIATGTLVELACGTGSLTRELARLGYDMIGCDLSPDMLSVAAQRLEDLDPLPLLICQDMTELELPAPVDGAVCALDSVNYITDQRRLRRLFARLHRYLRPGGLFVFDIKTTAWFEELDGVSSVWEEDGWFAAWQYGFDRRTMRALNAVDLFIERDGLYERHSELHRQRAYPLDFVLRLLKECGFSQAEVYQSTDLAPYQEESGRLYIAARREGD